MSVAIGGDAGQLAKFQERVARIEAKAKAGTQTCHVGDREMDISVIRALAAPERKPRRKRLGMHGMVLALLTGATAVMTVRLARALWMDAVLTADEAQTAMLTDLGLGLCAAVCVNIVFSQRWTTFLFLQMPAAMVMLVGMHNLVHLAPQLFETVFPVPWVETVLAETPPHSLILPGRAVTF